MATLFFYNKLEDPNLLSQEYFEGERLELDKIKSLIDTSLATYNNNKIFNTEGYSEIELDDEKTILKYSFIFQNNLGNYTTILFDELKGESYSTRDTYTYFAKCRVMITDETYVIIKATYSNEECGKNKSMCFFEEVGIELEPVRLTNQVFEKIKSTFEWSKIKIQKIEKAKDSTKSVAYEIDPASDMQSEVDKIYNASGVYEHITFNFPFNGHTYVVKLYKIGNKITVDESQFSSAKEFEDFSLELLKRILEMQN